MGMREAPRRMLDAIIATEGAVTAPDLSIVHRIVRSDFWFYALSGLPFGLFCGALTLLMMAVSK